MKTMISTFGLWLLMLLPLQAQMPRLCEGLLDATDSLSLGLAMLPGTETHTVFRPADHTDHYSNGVVMTAFKGTLYCMWQSSPTDEDSDDTWVAYSQSPDDGQTWSEPQPLSLPTDSFYCTSGGWLVCGDTLTAFVDVWRRGVEPRGGETWYTTSADGRNWSAMSPVLMADGTTMKGVLEQDPRLLPTIAQDPGARPAASVRLVGAAHFQPGLHVCPVYTDDVTGHGGWHRAQFECEGNDKQSRGLEPSQYLCADGTLMMTFRDQHSSFRKLAAWSHDHGETWTPLVVTTIPDARTKQCAGNLPDGSSFMVCCPVGAKRRWPLALLFSRDGHLFCQAFLLRSGAGTDLPARQYEGKAKTLGYSYPKAFIHNSWLYISYSTNKELVQFTRIPLAIIAKKNR